MRRLLLIVMMFVLPLQFSWTALAAVSAHAVEANAEGFSGHHGAHHEHGHDHDLPASQTASPDAVVPDAAAEGHDDGSTCHSHGHSHGSDFVNAAGALHLPAAAHCFADHRLRHVPDAVPDDLLRPPLADLA